LAVCVPGLTLCTAALAFVPTRELWDPLTAVLAACAVIGTRVSFDIEGTLFWDGSFLPIVCAAALLGPLPTVVITVVSELAVWHRERYRPRVIPLNLLGTVAPNLLAAWVLFVLGRDLTGASSYALLALVVCASIALNAALITALAGLLYNAPITERLRRQRRILGPIAVNVVVAMGAVAVYKADGVIATAFVIGGVFIFAFVSNRLGAERDQRLRITELAAARGRLVAQILDAEDRERRTLATALHDDLVQLLGAARQDLAEWHGGRSLSIETAKKRLDEAIVEARRLIAATHPSILDRVGLEAAVRAIAEQAMSRGSFAVTTDLAPDAIEIHDQLLFSAVRELLENVIKHAQARQVWISVRRHSDQIQLVVRDDGIGFEFERVTAQISYGHIGLQSLLERLEAVGGTLDIADAKPGSSVTVALPIELVDAYPDGLADGISERPLAPTAQR
jgi:two-component system NarL family sensor kinase